MSKMNFQKSSWSRNYNDNYIPPYERLLRRNRNWTPKKVKKEEQLKKLCEQGILQPFQQPENYSLYFIHSKTDIFVLDKLIDEAKLTYHYSMDTENDVLTHKPATLQVEFIRQDLPPIMIIIEAKYLPSINSPLFKKIQHLCSIIFTSNNTIYSWGSPLDELEKFTQFNLFDKKLQINKKDVQSKYDRNDKCGLQAVIESTFKQYLDKTATLAEWGCGVDLILGTYLPAHLVGPERSYRIREEEKYRKILKEYAMNDVFAVTKLVHQMNLIQLLTPPATVEPEEENHEQLINLQEEQSIELIPPNEELIVHVHDELQILNKNEFNYNKYSNYEEQGRMTSMEIGMTPSDADIGIFDFENISDDDQELEVHVDDELLNKNEIYYNEYVNYKEEKNINGNQDEPIELQLHDNERLSNKKKMSSYYEELEEISDDEILPEIMKIHRPFKQLDHPQQQRLNETKKVHVPDEPRKVRNSYYLGPQLYLPENATPNQIINRRHRANRYLSEVIRDVYHAFKVTDAKNILRAMNITSKNVNIRHGKLYIGLKEEQVDEVEQLLHRRMFTKDHYLRYMKKKKI